VANGRAVQEDRIPDDLDRSAGGVGLALRVRCVVAPGLRVVPRSAAFCNLLTVNIPLLLHLYLIVGIDRLRSSACNRVTKFISIEEEQTW
jgi:hypothetical protein